MRLQGSRTTRLLCSAARRSLSTGQFVEVEGARLWVVENGPSEPSGGAAARLPIVCMPGALGTAETDFAAQLDADSGLASTHRVISFDPRGYGRSRGPYTRSGDGSAATTPTREFLPGFYRRDADDVAELMASLGVPRYHVVGWSDGAIAATMLAAIRPAHVAALATFGGNAYLTPLDIEGFEATRDIATGWSKRMRASLTEVYGDELQPMWSAACDAWARIVTVDGGDVCRAEAAQIECPTLILHGEKDPMVLREHPQYFAHTIPGHVETHYFAEGKHNVHQRFAGEFNEVVRAHFDAVDGVSSSS